ncbi:unnamed protein product [Rotaria sordida]|uniref:RING-type domain-containing protein n=1 Tax=Rotaria sordida TaxID=392033 RepID=A0A818WAE0_9BILA|nr:unnamed protein product [Rotaria sordida]
MNDEWSRCPICYEDYSLIHRPTTFICGHSTCIDHTFGHNRLRECPICRHPLNQQHEYNISYNLEEAARLYHITKNIIDFSTIKLPSVDIQTNHTSTIHCNENYACRLQTKLDHEVQNEETITRPTTILAFIAASVLKMKKREYTGKQYKKCGHYCFLITTPQCCACSDQRPHSENSRYEKYVDGHGIKHFGKRNEHYCPGCKQD